MRSVNARPSGVDVVHQQAGIVGGEGDDGLHLGVLREALDARRVEAAATGVETERALVGATQPALDVGGVAQEERRGVHQHPPALVGLDRQRRQHRGRERIAHVLGLRRRSADGAVAEVLGHHQHARARALEVDHLGERGCRGRTAARPTRRPRPQTRSRERRGRTPAPRAARGRGRRPSTAGRTRPAAPVPRCDRQGSRSGPTAAGASAVISSQRVNSHAGHQSILHGDTRAGTAGFSRPPGRQVKRAAVSRRPPPGRRRDPSACRARPARWRAASDRR